MEGVRRKGGQIPPFNFEKSMYTTVKMSLQNENIYSYQLLFIPLTIVPRSKIPGSAPMEENYRKKGRTAKEIHQFIQGCIIEK